MGFSIGETVASAVVKEAVTKIRGALEDEVGLLWSFREDLEAMGDTLQAVHATLRDAAGPQPAPPARDERAQLLLRRLKSAAYDIEDMLEEFAARNHRQGGRSRAGEVSQYCNIVSLSRSIIAHKMKNMRERLQRIQADAGLARSNISTGSDFHDGEDNSRRETWPDFREDIVGREEDKERILSCLLMHSEEEISVVAIHGFGGLGKTTLARLVFNADPVARAFDQRVWVHVSTKYDLMKIGKSIVSKLDGRNYDDLDLLKKQLKGLLRNKTFLIVLDDIWQGHGYELESLIDFLNVGAKGSKILVTTRYEQIALKMNPILCYRLEGLSDEECWDLFKKRAFRSDAKETKLEQIGREIVKKCKGVPLAVKSLGFILQSKEGIDDWEAVRDSDIWEMEEDNDTSFEKILPSLKLSFHHMTASLKLCFAYCSLFPKGSDIDKDLMIQQWIALGLIQRTYGSPERHGEEYVKQLLGMSFLQISTTLARVTSKHIRAPRVFQMHDLVHDLATSVVLDDLLFLDTEDISKFSSTYMDCRYAVLVNVNPTATVCNNMLTKVRALHIRDCQQVKIRYKVLLTKFLRVLNLSGCSLKKLPNCINRLKLLRYLDASGMQDELQPKHLSRMQNLHALNLSDSLLGALPHRICCLVKMRYLNLHGCSNLSTLPDSFFHLRDLLHLDLSSCSVLRGLPLHIGNLVNLTFLNLSGCPVLKMLPESFSNLVRLMNLNLSSCLELTKLPENFGNLEILHVLDFSNCRKLDTLPESFANLRCLEDLNLSCCYELKELPELVGNLRCLRILDLSDCHKLQRLPESFTRLINLEVLILSDCWELSGLPESFGCLKKLQYLNLSNSQISALPESVGKLTKLEYMDLSWCMDLQNLPGFVVNLENLEQLNISYSSDGYINIPKGMASMSNLRILLADGFSYMSWKDEDDLLFFNDLSGYKSKFIFSGGLKPSDFKMKFDTLQVVSLGQVQNIAEVEELQLWRRHQMRSLQVTGSELAENSVSHEVVLEKLQPPRTLERFELWCCTFSTFPSWMMTIASFLPNLAHLQLCFLDICEYLPPLGQLPKLSMLVISEMPLIRKVGQQFSGGTKPFPKLRNLVIENMSNLEEWQTVDDNKEFMFPVLHHVKVYKCPKLIFAPFLPQCVSWEIEKSNCVLSSGVHSNDPSYYMPTTRMVIKSCELSSAGFMGLQCFISLKFLSMYSCKGLHNWRESMGVLTSLKSLNIKKSDVPECLEGLISLEFLHIQGCPLHHNTLQGVLSLTSLVDLKISCQSTLLAYEEEVSWLLSVLPYLQNLVNLELSNFSCCDRLPPLGQLRKLRSLTLGRIPNLKKVHMDVSGGTGSFPVLKILKIEHMRNLEEWSTTQVTGGREELTFPELEKLEVHNCPLLQFVPFLPPCLNCVISESNEVLQLGLEDQCPYPMLTSELSCIRLFLHSDCRGLQYFAALKSITVIECENLSSWCKGMRELTSLQNLELYTNEIPDGLGDLTSLRRLHINNCRLPCNLSQLVPHHIAFETLTIENCWQTLTELPEGEIRAIISRIACLEIIDCAPIRLVQWRNRTLSECKLSSSRSWYVKPTEAGALPVILGSWIKAPKESASSDATNLDQPGPSGRSEGDHFQLNQ